LVRLSRSFLPAPAHTNHSTAVIAADRASSAYDIEHTPQKKQAVEREREREALLESNKTVVQRAKEWATENRYPLLFGFWVASMAGSWSLVNRNRYLSGSQKLVQARMYAQGATLAALMTSFALEGADAAKGQGRWETIKVLDPNDPEHKHLIEKRVHHESYPGEDQWRGKFFSSFLRKGGGNCGLGGALDVALLRVNDCELRTDSHIEMIEAEEERIKERDAAKKARQEKSGEKETPAKETSSKETSSKKKSDS
jgi:hypothetical protein